MVLGVITSITDRLANVSKETLEGGKVKGDLSTIPDAASSSASIVPVVELVLGTITYLVSLYASFGACPSVDIPSGLNFDQSRACTEQQRRFLRVFLFFLDLFIFSTPFSLYL